MATVTELVFKAAFGDLVQAKGVMGDLKEKTDEAAKSAEKLEGGLSLASKAGLAFGAAVGTGLTALISMTKAGIEYADSINETSQRLTVGTEAFSGWVYGAKMAGVSQDELAGAITKLNNVMDDAYTGNEKAIATFERLGISVTDANGELKDTETVFYEVSDALSKYEDNASKVAVATDIFGKAAGPALVPYLNQGREGIEKLNAEALKFGLIITKDVAEAADQFGDKMDMMKGIVQGMGTQIAAGLLPTLSRMQESLLGVANDGTKMEGVIKVLDAGLKILMSTGIAVTGVFKTLGEGLGAIAAAVVTAAEGNFKQAWNILKQGFSDAGDNIKGTIKSIEGVWDETAAAVEGKSGKNGKKLAAPAKEAKDSAKKDVDDLKSIVSEIQNIADPLKVWNDKIADADRALREGRVSVEAHAAALQHYEKQKMKIIFAETEHEKAIREAAEAEAKRLRMYEEMSDPYLKYKEQLIEIDQLMEKYKEYPERMEMLRAAQEKVVENIGKVNKEAKNDQDEMMKDLIRAAEGYGQKMSSAFVDWMSGAKTNFSDMIRSMLTDMAKMLMYQAVMKPMMNGVMGMFGFSNGGVFQDGAPQPFADGLVSSPTTFPMANGATGMAGESGTEAIMPLRRDANGRLGVTAAGGGGGAVQVDAININISNVTAKDAPAVSEAARSGVDRAIRGMVQTEIFNQTRLGNGLNPMPLTAF